MEAIMPKKKVCFKFWRALVLAYSIFQTAVDLYEKVLEMSEDKDLRNIAAKLKNQIEQIRK